VQLFTIVLEQPIPFGISFLLAATIVLIVLKAAMSTEERRPRWVRTLTSSNVRILMTLLFIGWAVVFGLGLQLVPHEGANSPYGGIGLIALFSGFFIMMGFLWAVIGE
jgi:hypothetical protein